MPTFNYQCTNPDCQHVTEEVFLLSEEKPKELPCPKCGGVRKKVILESPAVHYKGSGFPSNDFKRRKR